MTISSSFFWPKKVAKVHIFSLRKKILLILVYRFQNFCSSSKNFENYRFLPKIGTPAKSRGLPMVFEFWPFQAKIHIFRFAHEFFRFREKILLILVYFFSLREKNNFLPLRGKKFIVKMHLSMHFDSRYTKISNIFIDFCKQKSIKISLHDLPRVYENRHFAYFHRFFICYANEKSYRAVVLKSFLCYAKKRF